MSLLTGARHCLRAHVSVPEVEIPEGRPIDLPGRGEMHVTEVAGPPGAPTLVLLHALGCTGMLNWFPAVGPLSQHFSLVIPDQRWHGRGLTADRFSLHDCADDVAALLDVLEIDRTIVVGYSMGSMIAQRVWRQHPDRVAGLVLCATNDRFRNSPSEVAFHQGMEVSMAALRGLAHSRTARRAARTASRLLDTDDIHEWALAEFRRTSPWAVMQAVASIGRHHSTPWLPRIDVPTAVVVTTKDRVLPAARQRALADLIPDATVHEAATGHAGCVLGAEAFVPVLEEACLDVSGRAWGRTGGRRSRVLAGGG